MDEDETAKVSVQEMVLQFESKTTQKETLQFETKTSQKETLQFETKTTQKAMFIPGRREAKTKPNTSRTPDYRNLYYNIFQDIMHPPFVAVATYISFKIIWETLKYIIYHR